MNVKKNKAWLRKKWRDYYYCAADDKNDDNAVWRLQYKLKDRRRQCTGRRDNNETKYFYIYYMFIEFGRESKAHFGLVSCIVMAVVYIFSLVSSPVPAFAPQARAPSHHHTTCDWDIIMLFSYIVDYYYEKRNRYVMKILIGEKR